MNPLAWVRENLRQPVRSSHTQEAIREADELLVAKKRMVEFTNDLDAGRIGEGQKVLRLSNNVLEEMVFPDRTRGRQR